MELMLKRAFQKVQPKNIICKVFPPVFEAMNKNVSKDNPKVKKKSYFIISISGCTTRYTEQNDLQDCYANCDNCIQSEE